MFGKTLNFDSKRVWDAFTYYIVQTVVLVGVATTLVYGLDMFGVVHEKGSFFAGGDTYRMIGSCFVLLVSSGILYSKGLSNDMFAFAVTMLAVWLSWHHSVMLGMVPVALMSTFDAKK
jgi:hypothetical protein